VGVQGRGRGGDAGKIRSSKFERSELRCGGEGLNRLPSPPAHWPQL
jgi:hypothetical protein